MSDELCYLELTELDGVPLAIQLVARHLEESLLLRAGAAFQNATDWHRCRPPLG
jgi:amidase